MKTINEIQEINNYLSRFMMKKFNKSENDLNIYLTSLEFVVFLSVNYPDVLDDFIKSRGEK
jgi:hypothetical protein